MRLDCIIKLLRERMIPTPFNKRSVHIEQYMDDWEEIEREYAHRLYGKDMSVEQWKQARLHMDNTGTITKLAVSDLSPVEPEIDDEYLPFITSTDHPTVYKYKGGLYVNDGNHRVSKAFLNKETHITVRLIDMDKLAEELGF